MRMRRLCLTLASLAGLLALLSAPAPALGRDNGDVYNARLGGYQEVPPISTAARGQLRLTLNDDEQTLTYELSYRDLSGPAAAAHIHFGQRRVSGGVVAFLCGGTKPACPGAGGTVRGTITAADIVGPESQGIAPGEFAEVVRALQHQRIYANVHSQAFPNGEIRGQLVQGDDNNPDDGGD